jgi:GrpB-like predicted nucleotidyltransferase (UPF0157 family)
MSTVAVSPYSTEWPVLFRRVREELLAVFAPTAVVVEHIGSTSVPGLAAKPVIDVLLGASTLADVEAKIEPLVEKGYSYISKYERKLPMRRYFVKKTLSASIPIHVHAVELGCRLWQEHLAFRDTLCADPAVRSQYEALKLRLAQEFADDKSAYTAAKGPFIQSILSTVLPTSRGGESIHSSQVPGNT